MDIHELANRLGVSTATVSRALNPSKENQVAAPLRNRVQALAKKLHYRPNQLARNFSKGRSHTIGVLIHAMFASTFFDDSLSKVIWGVQHTLAECPHWGWKIALLPHGQPCNEVDLHPILGGVDGLLFAASRPDNVQDLRQLARLIDTDWKLPLVALNMDPLPGSRISTLSFDNEDAGYKAATHLLQRQHRRIGMILAQDDAPDMKQRVKGYRRAMDDHHCAFDERMTALGDSSIEGGYEAAIALFKKPASAKLTALLCISDEMALGVLRALRALGKRCPADIAVMGFNGEALGEFSTPTISTVTQPVFEMARAGARLLIDFLEGRLQAPVHQTLPSQLVSRESV